MRKTRTYKRHTNKRHINKYSKKTRKICEKGVTDESNRIKGFIKMIIVKNKRKNIT